MQVMGITPVNSICNNVYLLVVAMSRQSASKHTGHKEATSGHQSFLQS